MPSPRRTRRATAEEDDFTPLTPYQEWINPAIRRAGITISDLADAVNADRTYLWRIARGNPETYPKQRRPGYELAYAIGEKLGDVIGSLKSAEYPIPSETRQLKSGETLNLWRTGQDGKEQKAHLLLTDELMKRLILEAEIQEGRE